MATEAKQPKSTKLHIVPINAEHSKLKEIPVDKIVRNPENPRIIIRPTELEELLESIRRYGVQVPVSVYADRNRYVLIDGERRWRCCIKLNKRTIPALVQAKPDTLTNLLLMFNIHALREQWDLLTIALKLPRVIDLLNDELGTTPNERDLAEHTGLTRAIIRRCKLLIELPSRYRQQILDELKKPKPQQKLTEDFFIEMERALKTVERVMPDVIDDKDRIRDVLIQKYKRAIIGNITSFRNLSKIARAERVAADRQEAASVLTNLFSSNEYSIDRAFADSVQEAYTERDLLTRIHFLIERLEAIEISEVDEEIRRSLQQLVARISRILDRLA